MKQKDIAMIIVVVFVSALTAFFLSRWLFASPESRKQEVEVVDVIVAQFPTPDKKYFNEEAINPTQLIEIGETNNPNPFNGSTSR